MEVLAQNVSRNAQQGGDTSNIKMEAIHRLQQRMEERERETAMRGLVAAAVGGGCVAGCVALAFGAGRR